MVLGHPSLSVLSTPLITSSRISAQPTTRHRLRGERVGRGTTPSRTRTRTANERNQPKSACGWSRHSYSDGCRLDLPNHSPRLNSRHAPANVHARIQPRQHLRTPQVFWGHPRPLPSRHCQGIPRPKANQPTSYTPVTRSPSTSKHVGVLNCANGRGRTPASSDVLQADSNVCWKVIESPGHNTLRGFTGLFPDHKHKEP
jgi:hypothetical protein